MEKGRSTTAMAVWSRSRFITLGNLTTIERRLNSMLEKPEFLELFPASLPDRHNIRQASEIVRQLLTDLKARNKYPKSP